MEVRPGGGGGGQEIELGGKKGAEKVEKNDVCETDAGKMRGV